jgi:hypothetical protein
MKISKNINNSLTTKTEAKKTPESSSPKIIDWESDLPPLASTLVN